MWWRSERPALFLVAPAVPFLPRPCRRKHDQMTHPPTDPRGNLSDAVSYLKTLADDAGRLARALAVHQKNADDPPSRGALHRCQCAAEDFARTITDALANLSGAARATIERSPQ